jgi:hypothetical protein
MFMMVVPSWRVYAQIKPPPPGGSALARPEVVLLTVSDEDLAVILKTLKNNGYDKIEAERVEFPTYGAFEHPEQEVS